MSESPESSTSVPVPTAPTFEDIGDLKKHIRSLRQDRKLHHIRLEAGLKYVKSKIDSLSEARESNTNKLMSEIQTIKNDLEIEKSGGKDE